MPPNKLNDSNAKRVRVVKVNPVSDVKVIDVKGVPIGLYKGGNKYWETADESP